MDPPAEVWPTQNRDFYSHLLASEQRLPQPIDVRERRLCVTWIVRACSDYGFRPATGGLSVKYFDAFLHASRCAPQSSLADYSFKKLIMKIGSAVVDITKHKESQVCELICICCIALAAKKTEPKVKAPFLGDFDENFTFQELRKMEHEVLDKLNWKLGYSTPHDYIHFWVGRAEWGVDRKKTIMLCNEAIGMCTVEADFANPRSAGIFGAGAMLWAYHAQGLPTAKLENEFTSIMGVEEEDDLHTAAEQIGSCLRISYPHAFKPRRAGSPTNVIDVPNMVAFSDDMATAQGVKRPKPEQFTPYHKLAVANRAAAPRSPALKAQKKNMDDIRPSTLEVMSNSTATY